ncbi:ABC transporter permease [Actinacidiphila glaucinigra]|uniref:ABC transporter permease n=1 Tax=Actinacidiphila glaucinigra TaxID=235986 RepID=UPI0036751779
MSAGAGPPGGTGGTGDPGGPAAAPGAGRVPAGPEEPADGGGPGDRPAAGPPSGAPVRRLTWRRLLVTPVALALVLLATYLWITGITLDSIAENALVGDTVRVRLWQHVKLTAISTFWVLVIAVPLGVALTRRRLRPAAPVVTAIANIGQATPAIGMLALLVVWLGIGPGTALVGMVVYAVLPVLSNTMAGLRAIDPTLIEASRGIGMSAAGTLSRIELPLAVPLILAGVRTALVLNVGTATLATFVGGGGLGDIITTGIVTQRMPVLVLGSVLTVVLALLVDWLASLAEQLLRPHGLETG